MEEVLHKSSCSMSSSTESDGAQTEMLPRNADTRYDGNAQEMEANQRPRNVWKPCRIFKALQHSKAIRAADIEFSPVQAIHSFDQDIDSAHFFETNQCVDSERPNQSVQYNGHQMQSKSRVTKNKS